jgi:hypothetical protein
MAQSHMQGNEKYKNRISAELQNLGLMQDYHLRILKG